jgi:hypothetical protein
MRWVIRENAWCAMRIANVAAPAGVALIGAALLGLAACATPTTVTEVAPSTATHAATPAPRSARPAPAVTKTVTMTPTAAPKTAAPAPAAAPASTAAPVAPAAAPAGDPNVTQPWAVVSAYYGDIESGDYAGAWALLDSGMTTGQTYQQFVDGYACTGSEDLSENWASGDQVNFDLAATDNCTGAVQDFSGTDTVQGGLIVAADISQS